MKHITKKLNENVFEKFEEKKLKTENQKAIEEEKVASETYENLEQPENLVSSKTDSYVYKSR